MIQLVSKSDGWEDTCIFDQERVWSRVMELAEALDKEGILS